MHIVCEGLQLSDSHAKPPASKPIRFAEAQGALVTDNVCVT